MDTQTLINGGFILIGFLGAWVLKSVTDNIKSLQKADKELTEKVQGLEVLVAGDYVKQDTFDDMRKELSGKLDKIFDVLQKKVDKT